MIDYQIILEGRCPKSGESFFMKVLNDMLLRSTDMLLILCCKSNGTLPMLLLSEIISEDVLAQA